MESREEEIKGLKDSIKERELERRRLPADDPLHIMAMGYDTVSQRKKTKLKSWQQESDIVY